MTINSVNFSAPRAVSFRAGQKNADISTKNNSDENRGTQIQKNLVKGTLITAGVALAALGVYVLTKGKKTRFAEEQRQLQQEIAEAIERDSRVNIKDDSILKRIEEKFVPKKPEKWEHDRLQEKYEKLNWDEKPVSREYVRKFEREDALHDDILYFGKDIDNKLAALAKKGVVSKVHDLPNGYRNIVLTYPESSAVEKVIMRAQNHPKTSEILSNSRKEITINMKNGNSYSFDVDGNDLHRSLMQLQGDIFASKYEISNFYKRKPTLDVESYGTYRSDFIDEALGYLEKSMKQSDVGDEAVFKEIRDLFV